MVKTAIRVENLDAVIASVRNDEVSLEKNIKLCIMRTENAALVLCANDSR